MWNKAYLQVQGDVSTVKTVKKIAGDLVFFNEENYIHNDW